MHIVLTALLAAVSASLGCWRPEDNQHFLFILLFLILWFQKKLEVIVIFFLREEGLKLNSVKTSEEYLHKILIFPPRGINIKNKSNSGSIKGAGT